MAVIFLGVGSNIDAEKNIVNAMPVLRDSFSSLEVSPVYRCPAFGFAGDDFFNLVIKAETQLSIEQVFTKLREIEYQFGRPTKSKKYSSRTLDIDLLMYDDFVGEVAGYQLPREDVERFDFVLKPLSDLTPNLIYPPLKISIEQMWQGFQQKHDSHLSVVAVKL